MNNRPILLVEDNADDEALTIRAFRKNDIRHEIVVARDGEEALACIFGRQGQSPLHPRIVLLDLKLPRIDGLEVLRRIRADPSKNTLPIVVLTSSREESDLAAGYRLGCNSYVRKPVDFDQFIDTVRQLGLYWLLLNQYPDMDLEVA